MFNAIRTVVPYGVCQAVIAAVLMLSSSGCKCLELDCSSAPSSSQVPPSLRRAQGGVLTLNAKDNSIPVTKNVTVCAGYEVTTGGVDVTGTVLVVTLNGNPVLSIEYNEENGKKLARVNLDDKLQQGRNELVIQTVVLNASFQGTTVKTRASVVGLNDGKKVIDECYPVPDEAYKPVSQTFILMNGGGGGGGGGAACAPCNRKLEARWVVGIDPARAMVPGAAAANRDAGIQAISAQLSQMLAKGGTVVRQATDGSFVVVTGLDVNAEQRLRGSQWFRYLEPDLIMRTQEVRVSPPVVVPAVRAGTARTTGQPNDPLYPQQADLPDIAAPKAWDQGHTAAGVLVAVVDTGASLNHPELIDRIQKGQDFACKRGDDVCDGNGHGTHVSGTILAGTNNSIGVAGIGWTGKVLAVKVLDENGSGYVTDVADGIRYAVDHGAKVINLSLGGYAQEPPKPLQEAAQYALEKGSVLVCAAGNDNNNNDGASRLYPASIELPNVIAVLATSTGSQSKAYFSDFGPKHVDIAAPGTNILSCWPNNEFRFLDGTSMASPHVAAALTVLWNECGPQSMPVDQRVQAFLKKFTVEVPGLAQQCEKGRYLQMGH